jgi:hypothetical protein
LGSIGVGATNAASARAMIEEVRSRTTRAFKVNLFGHVGALADLSREVQWLDWLAPLFAEHGAEPPKALRTIYKSFADDPDMVAVLLDLAPPVVGFHFGLPSANALSALRAHGIYLMSTASSLDEAPAIEAVEIDAVVVLGISLAGIGVSSTPPRRIRANPTPGAQEQRTRHRSRRNNGARRHRRGARPRGIGSTTGNCLRFLPGVGRRRCIPGGPHRCGRLPRRPHVAYFWSGRACAGQSVHGSE